MRILSVGPFSANNGNNTSKHRSHCFKKLGYEVVELDSCTDINLHYRIINKLSYYGIRFNLPDLANVNQRLIDIVNKQAFDIIWIDKGNVIYPSTLRKVKQIQSKVILVHYMIDDFMNPYHKCKQILDTIPLYDYYIVNRKANIEELKQYGCKNPICVYMSYDQNFHYPRTITEEERKNLGGDVGFIGTFEKERGKSIKYLVDNGIYVRVWGSGWNHLKNYSQNLKIEGYGIFDENFCKAIRAFKINLGFLRKKSRDLHTTRSTEIPACGGFMLAERTEEHLALFKEGKEAAFFSSNEELLQKCKYYLEHDNERLAIAKAGTLRCKTSDYSNERMVKKVINVIIKQNV